MTKASDGLTGVIWSNDAFAESEDDDGARCRHLNPVIRQRTRRNGSAAFIFQCDDCGEVLSEPVRRAVAEREAGERGITPFDEAALEAVRKWHFVPARHGDVAVAASVVVPLSFKLNS